MRRASPLEGCLCCGVSSRYRPRTRRDYIDDWQDIKLEGKPEFKGVRPDATGLNVYEWRLSHTPDGNWVQLLGNEMSLSTFHPIRVSGDVVTLTPPEGQLEAYAKHLRTKIASTNTKYRSILLPKLKEQGEQAARRALEEKERAERAAQEAAELSLEDDD